MSPSDAVTEVLSVSWGKSRLRGLLHEWLQVYFLLRIKIRLILARDGSLQIFEDSFYPFPPYHAGLLPLLQLGPRGGAFSLWLVATPTPPRGQVSVCAPVGKLTECPRTSGMVFSGIWGSSLLGSLRRLM